MLKGKVIGIKSQYQGYKKVIGIFYKKAALGYAQDDETIMSIVVDKWHYTFFKTHRLVHTIKNEYIIFKKKIRGCGENPK